MRIIGIEYPCLSHPVPNRGIHLLSITTGAKAALVSHKHLIMSKLLKIIPVQFRMSEICKGTLCIIDNHLPALHIITAMMHGETIQVYLSEINH